MRDVNRSLRAIMEIVAAVQADMPFFDHRPTNSREEHNQQSHDVNGDGDDVIEVKAVMLDTTEAEDDDDDGAK